MQIWEFLYGNEFEKAIGEKGVDEIYLQPDEKDSLKYSIVYRENGEYKEINLPTPRGTNPTDRVIRMENEHSKEEQATGIYILGNDRALTISGTGSYAQASIANRTPEGDWLAITVADKTKEGTVGGVQRDLREAGGDTYSARKEGMERKKIFYEIRELSDRNVPEDADLEEDSGGIEAVELKEEDFMRKLTERIEIYLNNNQSINTDDAKEMAPIIARKVVYDDVDFNEAFREELQNREQGNNIDRQGEEEDYGPWSNSMSRRGY